MAKTWTIGSDPGCDLVAAPPASPRHARLTIGPGYALLEDLASARGTYVNDVRITGEVVVTRHDAIKLGNEVPMPWPDAPVDAAPMALRIGREPDNDLVVNLPTVSGRHARVTWSGKPGEAEIEDLGSSNGTAVGRLESKITRAKFTPSDTVYLGTSPISGSALLARVDPTFARVLTPVASEMVIGRAPESDRFLDLVTISGRHAKLSRSGGRVTIEDLGSSNGTFVNGRRIEGPTPLEPGDLIGLGHHMMRFAPDAMPARGRVARTVAEPIPALVSPPPLKGQAVEEEAASGTSMAVRLAALVAEAPVAAMLILGIFGGRAAGDPNGGGAVAAVLFLAGLSAIGFGLSNAIIGGLPGAPRPSGGPPSGPLEPLAVRLCLLGGICVVQCLVLWVIVAAMGGLRGPWAGSIAILILSSMVGAALGSLILTASPRREWGWAAIPIVLGLLWLFGGGPGSLTRLSPVAGLASSAAPSRWAFEALLLLESDRAGPPDPAEGPSAPARDLAEGFFPAETERMGPGADTMALASMLVGLSAAAAFVTRAWAAGPSPRAAT